MPQRVRLVQGRAGQATSRGGGLSLVVLELIGTLAAHAIEVISSARVFHPRMATLATMAKLPKPPSSLSTLSAPFQKGFHGTSMHDLACGHAATRVVGPPTATGRGGSVSPRFGERHWHPMAALFRIGRGPPRR